jgi:hypothetical protein
MTQAERDARRSGTEKRKASNLRAIERYRATERGALITRINNLASKCREAEQRIHERMERDGS